MLETLKKTLAAFLFGDTAQEEDFYQLALESGFTDSDAEIFGRIAYNNNFTPGDIEEVISSYKDLTVAGTGALRIWNAFKVIGGLSEIVQWLEFPASIDAVRRLKIDPVTVKRAFERFAYSTLVNEAQFTLVGLNWQEADGSKTYGTNLILDTASGLLYLVVVEATADLALGELVGVGTTSMVGDNITMRSKIYKDDRTRDVYYQSEKGSWMITGPSTDSPELYPGR